MSKRVVRTESQESRAPDNISVGDPVWFFEHRDGLRYEHLACVEAINHDDGTLDLTFKVTGDRELYHVRKIPQVNSSDVCSAWARAK